LKRIASPFGVILKFFSPFCTYPSLQSFFKILHAVADGIPSSCESLYEDNGPIIVNLESIFNSFIELFADNKTRKCNLNLDITSRTDGSMFFRLDTTILSFNKKRRKSEITRGIPIIFLL